VGVRSQVGWVTANEPTSSADLGVSSNYFGEKPKDGSGEGFLLKVNPKRVNRS